MGPTRILFGTFGVALCAQGPCLNGGEYYQKNNKCYYMGGARLDPDKWIGLKDEAETWIQAERKGFKSEHIYFVQEFKIFQL